MTAVSDQHAPAPEALRAAMTQRLADEQVIRSPAVRAAFAAVARHLFIPHVPAQAAYADEPVYTKTAGDGARISAASQPRIVAMMLEQLDPHPGHRVLEAGAGTPATTPRSSRTWSARPDTSPPSTSTPTS